MLNRTQAEVMQSWPERAGPVVSICCITYNHEGYISQAIDSFLMQETDFPFEIIVHDDASTDGTTEIVLGYAEKYLRKDDIAFRTVQLHGLGIQSGLTGRGEKGRFEGVHEMHVPSRNLMFVGIAASVAEDMGIDTVWYGADYSDFINKFPDCMQPWFGAMNDVLQINGPTPIKLEAPLAGLTKETILEMLDSKGVTSKDMYSGYGDL